MTEAAVYFQQPALPEKILAVNRESIKWLQAWFDEGQASMMMPWRKKGVYFAWRQLIEHDARLHGHHGAKKAWLRQLPESAEHAVMECLKHLKIAREDQENFLTLMLTTLPGWAAHVKYRTDWVRQPVHHCAVTKTEYIAMRLVITCLLWPEANQLLAWHNENISKTDSENITSDILRKIQKTEAAYRLPLLRNLASQQIKEKYLPEAQIVFCIDVRSEPFRCALESAGNYETFGFAGFFGVPVQVTDAVTCKSHASCPVLLSPEHEVKEWPACSYAEYMQDIKGYEKLLRF